MFGGGKAPADGEEDVEIVAGGSQQGAETLLDGCGARLGEGGGEVAVAAGSEGRGQALDDAAGDAFAVGTGVAEDIGIPGSRQEWGVGGDAVELKAGDGVVEIAGGGLEMFDPVEQCVPAGVFDGAGRDVAGPDGAGVSGGEESGDTGAGAEIEKAAAGGRGQGIEEAVCVRRNGEEDGIGQREAAAAGFGFPVAIAGDVDAVDGVEHGGGQDVAGFGGMRTKQAKLFEEGERRGAKAAADEVRRGGFTVEQEVGEDARSRAKGFGVASFADGAEFRETGDAEAGTEGGLGVAGRLQGVAKGGEAGRVLEAKREGRHGDSVA